MTALQDNGNSNPGGTKIKLADDGPLEFPTPASLRDRLLDEARHQIAVMLNDSLQGPQKFLVSIDQHARYPIVAVHGEQDMIRSFSE